MIPTINMAETGARIKLYMDLQGCSVKDIQNELGLACPQGVYKWIHGDSLPSLDNLVALAAVFHVSINDILVIE